ncbi:MAG: metal ABC transporter permease [Verrucomicrobiota bacterium]
MTTLEILNSPFVRNALIASLIACPLLGVAGTYVVMKRISYIAGAVAHSALGGIGACLYAREVLGWSWADPMIGAMMVAVVSALVIGLVTLGGGEREDTVIGAIWAVGMAAGILFIKEIPGQVQLNSWLFGNLSVVTPRDVGLIASATTLTGLICFLFHRQFAAVCFDDEFVRVRGVSVTFFYLLLLCLVAVTVVLLVRVVGVILVIALLTLPAAAAAAWARSLPLVMGAATVICVVAVVGGFLISVQANLVTGPVIILLVAVLYLAAVGLRKWKPAARGERG